MFLRYSPYVGTTRKLFRPALRPRPVGPVKIYAGYTRCDHCGIYDSDPRWCDLCGKPKDARASRGSRPVLSPRAI